KPYQARQDAPAMALARQALQTAWGAEAVDTGLGGSIPFIADLLEVFPEAEVLVTGVEDPESRAHGIDESLHLGALAHVCLAEAVETGLGGSIPFIADLFEVFPEAEVLVTGVEDPESRAHGIDESLHLGEFAHVCLAEALLLRGAGELGTDQAVSSEGTA